jgi:hypothetical protein
LWKEFRNAFNMTTSVQVLIEMAQDIRDERSTVKILGIHFKVLQIPMLSSSTGGVG